MLSKWLDMPVENLLVILIVVVLLVLFAVLVMLWGKSGGNHSSVKIEGTGNHVNIKQIDQSVRQTENKAHIPVRITTADRSTGAGSSSSEADLAIYGVVFLGLVGLYVRFFDIVSFGVLLLSAGAVGAGLAVPLLAVIGRRADAMMTMAWALPLLLLAAGAGWMVYDALRIIDPRLVAFAQTLQVDGAGLGGLWRVLWTQSLWPTTLASAAICSLGALACIKVIKSAWRVGTAGSLGQEWKSLGAMFLLIVIAMGIRFWLLPHALTLR
jgi:hypothetical protein